MIAVDASALVAVMTEEAGFERLEKVLLSATDAIIAPVAIFEAVLAIARKHAIDSRIAEDRVQRVLQLFRIRVVPIEPSHASLALDALARFGKGRHPAALNMGDCFAYALARAHDAALLYKGDDFVKTDIRAAVDSA